jgi:hypothetical protein
MKRLFLAIILLSSLAFGNNKCPQVKEQTIVHVLHKASQKIGDKTVETLIKLGEKGAAFACQGVYQLICNASLDAETAGTGSVVCGGTGAVIVRQACKQSIKLVSKNIQNIKKIKKAKRDAKKEISNYFYNKAKPIAKRIVKNSNRELKKDCDRLKNKRKLSVINKTSHNVLFSVDVKDGPDSQCKRGPDKSGVAGNLPLKPKTFTVKAKVFVHPWEVKFLKLHAVDPDKYKVEVYKKDGGYHIKKITK